MKPVLSIIIFSFYTCYLSFSQESIINAKSNIDSTLVFLDTLFIGYTPVESHRITPGNYTLRAIRGVFAKWDREVFETTIKAFANNSQTINVQFKNSLQIRTEPENASILLNKKFIGYSPINIVFSKNDTLSIEKKGFIKENVPLYSIDKNLINIKLTSQIQDLLNKNTIFAEDVKTENSDQNISLYFLIGAGITFGTVAVITKNRADNYETDYRNSNDQNLKEKIKIYDSISNISLLLFEGCFLGLSYLLLRN